MYKRNFNENLKRMSNQSHTHTLYKSSTRFMHDFWLECCGSRIYLRISADKSVLTGSGQDSDIVWRIWTDLTFLWSSRKSSGFIRFIRCSKSIIFLRKLKRNSVKICDRKAISFLNHTIFSFFFCIFNESYLSTVIFLCIVWKVWFC